jgi:pimeloyl-ACP methyl ester carboxylesterase
MRTRDRIDLDGVGIAYADSGDEGPAVACIHGLGGSMRAWEPQIDAVAAAGYRAIAHDARGAGRSDVPDGPYSVEGWAADAVALVDALNVERAVLVGHSVGTMVAEHAALALGDRCLGLVLIGGALAWPEESRPVFEQRAELARAGRLDEVAAAVAQTGLSERCRASRPDLEDAFRAMIEANDPDGYAESALATSRGRMIDPGRLECPALAVAGGLDQVTPPAAAEAIAAAIPNGRSETIPGAAHWCQVEDPEAVSAALLAFLRDQAT